jgi:hypothetical protein
MFWFIIFEFREDVKKEELTEEPYYITNLYVCMTLLSWFGLLQHLRLKRSAAEFVHLILMSFVDIREFLFVLIILAIAFALSIFYLDTNSIGLEYEGEDFVY